MYSIVLHPLYLGNFLIWLGVAFMTFHFWFVLVTILSYWIYYERIMIAEEQFLRRKYNQEYIQWAEETPTFIPKFSLWKKAGTYFNFRKVLRQEKNALFAIFLMFMLLDTVRMHDRFEDFVLNEWYWFLGTLLSALVYFVLKLLKYKTNFLADPL